MKCDKYIVKPEEGIVVGELKRTTPKNINQELNGDKFLNYLYFAYGLKDINDVSTPFKAVARCQAGDEFSENTGKQIVNMKCAYKYHMTMRKRYCRMMNKLRNLLNKIGELERQHRNAAMRLDDKLADYL